MISSESGASWNWIAKMEYRDIFDEKLGNEEIERVAGKDFCYEERVKTERACSGRCAENLAGNT